MIKLKQILFFFLFLIFCSSNSFALNPACYDFLNEFKEYSKNNPDYTWNVVNEYNDYGLTFNYDSSKQLDFKNTEFLSKIRRDKRNYPLVGLISNSQVLEYLKPNDILISLNGIDLSDVDDEKLTDIFFNPDDESSFLVYETEGKSKQVELKKIKYDISSPLLDFEIYAINKIDILNSIVTFTGGLILTKEYDDNGIFPFVDLAKKHLATYEKNSWSSTDCYDIPKELALENRILFPINQLSFPKLLYEDQDLVTDSVDIYFTEDEDEQLIFNISGSSVGTWKIRNEFNLLSFPFDKQKIKIAILDESNFEENFLQFSDISYRSLDLFNKNSIPGWKITDTRLTVQNNFDFGNLVFNEGSIEIEIERQSFYYIFKIILPIMLILFVCWSSVWIDKREIESKLTITIVCLLSLIAYNFVIDNELPKLSYLTVMDWIILASYIYAAAPNILAILSFQLSKIRSKNKIETQISMLSRRFGILSYFLIVIIIILINVNTVPENTINALNWAMFKTNY